MLFTQYKIYIYTAIFLIYSVFLWNTAQNSVENRYLKEAQEALQLAADAKQRDQSIADIVGSSVAAALEVYQRAQAKQSKELLNEINKAPVYHECVNTPAVVQHLKDSRDRANKAAK